MPVEFGVVNFLYRARLEFVDQPVNNEHSRSFIHLVNHQELLYPGQGQSGSGVYPRSAGHKVGIKLFF